MKRLMIFAAVAAVSALALAGGASAKSFRMSEQERELCLLLELAHESTCAEYAAKLTGQHAVADVLDASDEATGSIAADRPAPESLTQ